MPTVSALAASSNIIFPTLGVNQRLGKAANQPSQPTTQVNSLDHRQVARHQHGDVFVPSSRLNTVNDKLAMPKVTEQISKPVLDAPASAFASFGSMLGNIFSLNN
jgi:hypothetical protein